MALPIEALILSHLHKKIKCRRPPGVFALPRVDDTLKFDFETIYYYINSLDYLVLNYLLTFI